MTILKNTILGVVLAATALATVPANAQDWRLRHGHHGWHNNGGWNGGQHWNRGDWNGGQRWNHGGWRGNRWHDNHGDAVAAGIAGLALGAIAAGALADRGPVYDSPPPRYQPRYAYEGSLRPWSRAWYRYCDQRYRTFDPGSGTYIGNDGREHFCVAN
ncbi:MAG: BA14K family protein [Rhizobiales bacterium]|nr:BA14K family protein [Hyphomicrobiales bacterium]